MLAEVMPGPAAGITLTPTGPDRGRCLGGGRGGGRCGLLARWWPSVDPQAGLTASTKAVTRAQILAAVAAATPALGSAEELESFNRRRDRRRADRTGAGGARSHHSNTARFTTADIVAAETVILEAAAAGIGADPTRAHLARARAVLDGLDQAARAAGGPVLSGEQRAAVLRLTCGNNAVEALVGRPGPARPR